MAKMQPFWWFLPPPPIHIDLPVNLFTLGQIGDWTTHGANPWLDKNDGDTSWIGWFGGSLTLIRTWSFAHTTLTSFSKIEIHIKARQTMELAESDLIYLTATDVPLTYIFGIGITKPDWFDFYHDITDIINTIAKINSVGMVIYNGSGCCAHITYAFLRVYL